MNLVHELDFGCECKTLGNGLLPYLRPMRKYLITFFALAFFTTAALAQFQVRDSTLFDPRVSLGIAYQTPGGDLATRFRDNLSISLGFHIKTKKNLLYGIHGQYFFGNKVSEPGFLDNLRTENGEILDNQGLIAIISPQERGYGISFDFGKLWNVLGPNPNSGLVVRGGFGYLQHKIRIEHQESEITQLEGDYLKGYDRLCSGLMINEFIGYDHMSNSGLINFFVGFEFYQAFTSSRRTLNFDTGLADTKDRFDTLLGLRAGWVLHLYQRAPPIQYFN